MLSTFKKECQHSHNLNSFLIDKYWIKKHFENVILFQYLMKRLIHFKLICVFNATYFLSITIVNFKSFHVTISLKYLKHHVQSIIVMRTCHKNSQALRFFWVESPQIYFSFLTMKFKDGNSYFFSEGGQTTKKLYCYLPSYMT